MSSMLRPNPNMIYTRKSPKSAKPPTQRPITEPPFKATLSVEPMFLVLRAVLETLTLA